MTTRSERTCPVCGYQVTLETIADCPRCSFDLTRANDQVYLSQCRQATPRGPSLRPSVPPLSLERQHTRAAKGWYWWLWLSPLLTLPTAVVAALIVYGGIGRKIACGHGVYTTYYHCDYTLRYRASLIPAFLVSALWHLLLLIPARDKRTFVRWHGRQALALAGLRTAVPLMFTLAFREESIALFIPLLIVIWFAGTWWGYRQARLGECSLMRWLGHQQELAEFQRLLRRPVSIGQSDPDALVEAIRFNPDPTVRRQALDQLASLGMVESL